MKKIRGFFSITMSLALALALVVGDRQPVRAAAITVDSTADELNSDGDCSLREAIQAANTNTAVDACPGGSGTETDTITFAATTNGTPIILIGPAAEDANASGDLDILAGGDLTIQGNGIANTIIDGDGIDRVFHICPGGGCDEEVTISGVTIQNGTVTLSGGGGLRNEGGTTTLEASALLSNIAVNGGGIANFATLNIQNGTKIGEPDAGNWAYAGNGGGIYNYAGSTTIDASSVISNTAANNGGGVFVYDGSTTIDASNVISNMASSGGGIYNWAALDVQNGSLISFNSAIGTDMEEGGGGIYNNGGTVRLENSTVNDNIVAIISIGFGGGGGISNQEGTVTLNECTVSDNYATDGGGIYTFGGTLTLEGSVVSDNYAEILGGGIFNWSTITVSNSTISNNTANSSGGGIRNHTGTLLLIGSVVSDNNVVYSDGGGIDAWGGTISLEGSVVSDNTAIHGGGGIAFSLGTLTLIDSTVSGNMVSDGDGGGIANYSGSVTLDSSTVTSNTANENGGGIFNLNDGAVTASDSRILNNTAAGEGGGLYNGTVFDWLTPTITVTSSCIVDNSDTSFFNELSDIQIATGNWWGTVSGPSGAGPGTGDSVSANIDFSGFLTEPPSACLPDVYLPLVRR